MTDRDALCIYQHEILDEAKGILAEQKLEGRTLLRKNNQNFQENLEHLFALRQKHLKNIARYFTDRIRDMAGLRRHVEMLQFVDQLIPLTRQMTDFSARDIREHDQKEIDIQKDDRDPVVIKV